MAEKGSRNLERKDKKKMGKKWNYQDGRLKLVKQDCCNES